MSFRIIELVAGSCERGDNLLGSIKGGNIMTIDFRRGTSCLVFGRAWDQISARRPAILTEVFRGFPQSLQANSEIAP
jgi:hypothetical protein